MHITYQPKIRADKHLNKPTMHSAIEAIIKTLPVDKTNGQMDSQQNSKQTLKKINANIPQIIPQNRDRRNIA